ncbi:hypothetical protein Q9L58_009996, partial [Maublancomyces gigas]
MSSEGIKQPESHPRHAKLAPPPIPNPRRFRGESQSLSSSTATTRTAVFSKYLMNDIPRGTIYSRLMNSLLTPAHAAASEQIGKPKPHVQCSLVITDSRLDDGLSVAKIEFSDTPKWLQELSDDPTGFPKKTKFGTIWKFPDIGASDLGARDADGKTEFMRAVINGKERADLFYPEMLAEFDDVDVNIQDVRGWTALHWACDGVLEDMVKLCLSVPDCNVGLKDNEGRTAFDLSLQSGQEVISVLFYSSIFEMEQFDPPSALLRVLTFTDPIGDQCVFPGEAMFEPIENQNLPLVTALLNRRVDLTVRNKDGDTALHVAATQVGTAAIAKMLLEAGTDVNAIGRGGCTPLHHAAATADEDMVKTLLHWKADMTYAAQNRTIGIARILEDHRSRELTKHSQADELLLPPSGDERNTKPELINQRILAEPDDAGRRDALKRGDMPATKVLKHANEFQAEQLVSPEAMNDINQRNDVLAAIKTHEPGCAALRDALRRGDQDTTEVLLGLGVNREGKDSDGRTMLLLAVQVGYCAGVVMLLESGVNTEAVQSHDGSTALHVAALAGQREMVDKLLAASANIEAVRSNDGSTALHLAARDGRKDIVDTLLAAGANIEAVQSNDRSTPLHLAALAGQKWMVDRLLAAGANIEAIRSDDGSTALHVAALNRRTDSVDKLLAAGANMEAIRSYDGSTALHVAARDGLKDIVDTLLAAGANIEAVLSHDGSTPTHLAALAGQNRMVDTLLAAGANIEAMRSNDGSTPLHLAVREGRKDIVVTLLAAGANIDAVLTHDGSTALHLAVRGGQMVVVDKLLAAGANIEAVRSRDESTALYMAARQGHKDIVDTLIAAGANIEAIRSDDGSTALHVAARDGRKDIVDTFLAAGANIDA